MKKMSVLGIGPVYVISCLIITILSIYIFESKKIVLTSTGF